MKAENCCQSCMVCPIWRLEFVYIYDSYQARSQHNASTQSLGSIKASCRLSVWLFSLCITSSIIDEIVYLYLIIKEKNLGGEATDLISPLHRMSSTTCTRAQRSPLHEASYIAGVSSNFPPFCNDIAFCLVILSLLTVYNLFLNEPMNQNLCRALSV